MSETPTPAAEKKRKLWTTPDLRRYELTEDEVEALRASDDPMALLVKLKPEIKDKKADR